MNDNTPNSNNGPWWKPAMQVFSQVSTWIAVPIILAVIAGEKLDEHYDSGHKILISLSVLAFVLSAYGIVRTVKRYAEKLKKQMDKK